MSDWSDRFSEGREDELWRTSRRSMTVASGFGPIGAPNLSDLEMITTMQTLIDGLRRDGGRLEKHGDVIIVRTKSQKVYALGLLDNGEKVYPRD